MSDTTATTHDRAVYTVPEVATLLDLSLGSTYAAVRAGEIPAKKLGGRWVIPRRRFQDWLNGDSTPDAGAEGADSDPDGEQGSR